MKPPDAGAASNPPPQAENLAPAVLDPIPITMTDSTESNCPVHVWPMRATVALFALLVAILIIGVATTALLLVGRWIIILIFLTAFTLIAGLGVTGLWGGVMIDERNRMSLSRFQLALWVILFLSTWLTVALNNIRNNVTDPLGIAVPQELLLILGISTTSLIGSPLLLSTKETDTPVNRPRPADMAVLQAKANAKRPQGVQVRASGTATPQDNGCEIKSKGQVVVMSCPECASVADLFMGEDTGNGAHLDLARIQMFYFTLVLVLAYAVQIWNQLGTGSFASFPPINSGMVTLLGISHAGYLMNKVVPH